jgi:predicted HAD superfamily Cof-like phosphohydrolase
MSKYIDIVFDGPPAPQRPGFIEVENDVGKSISVGHWVERKDGSWALRLGSDNGDVLAFQQKFDVPMAPSPAFLDEEAETFRVKFMQEELDEFQEACDQLDLAKAADALVDLVYVVHGTALMMGLPWQALWAEVQRANMEKVRATSAEQSKRRSTLDVIKPEGWRPPNHVPALGCCDPYAIFDTKTRTLK